MKRILTAGILFFAAASGFAQGKVTLANDVNSPILMGPVSQMLAPDAALAGLPVPTSGPLPSGITLTVGLYAGPLPAALTLQGKVDLNPVGGTGLDAGTIPATHIILTGLPGGTVANFQLRIWPNVYPTFEAATSAYYVGLSATFTMIRGDSIAYPNIYNGGDTTWQTGPIILALIPEPSTAALGGLGAALWLLPRRKAGRN